MLLSLRWPRLSRFALSSALLLGFRVEGESAFGLVHHCWQEPMGPSASFPAGMNPRRSPALAFAAAHGEASELAETVAPQFSCFATLHDSGDPRSLHDGMLWRWYCSMVCLHYPESLNPKKNGSFHVLSRSSFLSPIFKEYETPLSQPKALAHLNRDELENCTVCSCCLVYDANPKPHTLNHKR